MFPFPPFMCFCVAFSSFSILLLLFLSFIYYNRQIRTTVAYPSWILVYFSRRRRRACNDDNLETEELANILIISTTPKKQNDLFLYYKTLMLKRKHTFYIHVEVWLVIAQSQQITKSKNLIVSLNGGFKLIMNVKTIYIYMHGNNIRLLSP